MKILFIVKSFPRISQTFVTNQLTGLIDLGHEVTFVAVNQTDETQYQKDVLDYNLLDKVFYIRELKGKKNQKTPFFFYIFQFFFKNIFKRPFKTVNSFNIIRFKNYIRNRHIFKLVNHFKDKKFDIIFCNFGDAGNYGLLLKELGYSENLVAMFHGEDIRKGLQSEGKIYRRLFSKANYILSVSEYNKKSLTKMGVDTEKLVKISNTVEFSRIPKVKYPKKFKKDVNILSVGRLVWEKGYEFGLPSVKKVIEDNPEFELKYHIVGDGPLRKDIQDLITKLKLENNVKLHGALGVEEVWDLMRKSDIFFLCSVAEALPTVLMEAGSAGLPSVTTNVGSAYELVLDKKTGFVVGSKDILSMANALFYLVKNQELWEKFGKNALNHMQENYNLDKELKKLNNLFENLVRNTK